MPDRLNTNISTGSVIATNHGDMIHDVAYNHFGDRMATCSSDQMIKVWDLDNETKQWKCVHSWKAHKATIWRIDWAHPEFGQIIVACSFDRTASIWEEQSHEDVPGQITKEWVARGSLVESRTAIKDIEFAPKHLGFKLATITTDGWLRIYDAHDVLRADHWQHSKDFDVQSPCCCLTWNTSVQRVDNPMIAVGCDSEKEASIGNVRIIEKDNKGDWKMIREIKKILQPVNDLKFAPDVGRSYQTLAVASNDLHLYKIEDASLEDSVESSKFPVKEDSSKLIVEEIAHLKGHECNVLRLSWNMLGTLLVSSGDDGNVLMWMSNYMGIWNSVDHLKVEQVET